MQREGEVDSMRLRLFKVKGFFMRNQEVRLVKSKNLKNQTECRRSSKKATDRIHHYIWSSYP
jgi:hypothetical protein